MLIPLLLAGCSAFGLRDGYDEPAYEIAERLGETTEVRSYAARLAAEVTVEAGGHDAGRNAAFRLLFDYISGENRRGARIAMTTPVETGRGSEEIAMTVPVETAREAAGALRMRFFLPRSYDAETAPEPLNPRVRLVRVAAQTIAVQRFSGSRREAAVAAKTQELLRTVADSSWRPAADPIAYFYDPPWTLPWFRRNEVAVAVAG